MTDKKYSKKKTVGSLISLLTAVLLILSMLPGWESKEVSEVKPTAGSCGENATYTLDENGTLIISGTGKIIKNAFRDRTEILSVVINEGLTAIGEWTFYGCSNLTSITLPEGITSIWDCAFYGCSSLTDITIPKGVTSIGKKAFYGCSSLESICIPEGVTGVGEDAFRNCGNLAEIYVAEENIHYASESGLLFNKAKTKLIYCPGGMEGTVSIPEGVAAIEDAAFDGCSRLTEILVAAGNKNYASERGLLLDKAKTTLIYCPRGMKGAVIIPEGVTGIGDKAFYGCSSLTSITIPESVISIGNYVFCNCSALISVSIPEGVTGIGRGAFVGCSSLKSIRIPRGVNIIQAGSFMDCTSIKEIHIPKEVVDIETGAFYNCNSLKDVYYAGDRLEWQTVRIDNVDNGNVCLINAGVRCHDKEDY